MKKPKIIFVTGTDTGVGKTLLTAMLVMHLRRSGCHALAMKPFCSGGTADIRLLRAAQGHELTSMEINPYYFPKPIAPFVAAKTPVPMRDALAAIRKIADRCDTLLVEGAGGLLVPLGHNYFVADVISKLACHVILVARNKLGTINHTLLSCESIKRRFVNIKLTVVLMDQSKPDLSSISNAEVLRRFLPTANVFSLSYMGAGASKTTNMESSYRKCRKLLKLVMHDA